MAKCMHLTEKQKYEFFDKAILINDIPPDIKQIILSNPILINKIRDMNKKGEL